MLKTMLLGGLIAALLGNTVVDDPAPDPDPGPVWVYLVSINGAGCQDGTAAVRYPPEGGVFSVSYSGFTTAVGIGAPPTGARKDCQITLDINAPNGFAFAVAGVRHSGYASMAPGTSATLRTRTFFQNDTDPRTFTDTLTSPLNDDVNLTDATDPATPHFSPCGYFGSTYINMELRLSVGTSDPRRTSSFVALESTIALPLIWKRC